MPDSYSGPYDTREDAIEGIEEAFTRYDFDDAISEVAIAGIVADALAGYDALPYTFDGVSRIIEIVTLTDDEAKDWESQD